MEGKVYGGFVGDVKKLGGLSDYHWVIWFAELDGIVRELFPSCVWVIRAA